MSEHPPDCACPDCDWTDVSKDLGIGITPVITIDSAPFMNQLKLIAKEFDGWRLLGFDHPCSDPPSHPNCRCVLVPVADPPKPNEGREAGLKVLEGLGKPRTEPIKLPRIEAELSWLVSDYPFDDIYIPDPEFFVPQIPPPPMVRRCKHCGQEPGTDRHPDCRSNPDRGADGANHEDVVSVDAASIIGMDVGEESSFSIGIKIPPGMAEAFKKMADVGKDLGASFDAMADVGKDLGASFDAMAVKIGEMVSALTGKNAPKTWPQVYKEHKYLKRMASRRKHHAHRRRKR